MNEETHRANNRNNKSIYQVTLSALFLALSVIFAAISKYVVPMLHLPNGGSVSLVMMSLALCSLTLGPLYGLFVSLIFALINLAFDGAFAYNFMSLILDYFVAFPCCIICSLFRKKYYENNPKCFIYSLLLFGLLRFTAHFFSGVLISWTSDVGELKPNFSPANVLYSFGYNISYVLPSTIISMIALVSISKPLFTLNNTKMMKAICPYKEEELHPYSKRFFFFENAMISLLVILTISSIISCIPYKNIVSDLNFNMYYLGYISFILVFIFDGICIYKISNNRNNEEQNSTQGINIKGRFLSIDNIDTLIFFLSYIPLILSIISIVSYYTYGYDFYHPVNNDEETSLLFNLLYN